MPVALAEVLNFFSGIHSDVVWTFWTQGCRELDFSFACCHQAFGSTVRVCASFVWGCHNGVSKCKRAPCDTRQSAGVQYHAGCPLAQLEVQGVGRCPVCVDSAIFAWANFVEALFLNTVRKLKFEQGLAPVCRGSRRGVYDKVRRHC